MKLEGIIYGKIPTVTAQQKGISSKNGKTIVFEKDKVRQARIYYQFAIKEALFGKGQIQRIAKGTPVYLSVIFKFHRTAAKYEDWKVTRPDLDNMLKLLIDSMMDLGILVDDSQIVGLTASKTITSEQESISIYLRSFDE